MCSDDPETIIIRTEKLDRITEFSLEEGAAEGSVMIEAGVTFFTLAEYLHERKASMGYALVSCLSFRYRANGCASPPRRLPHPSLPLTFLKVNWNISLAGAIAMGAHRSSLREDSMVGAGALELHIIDGQGNLRIVKRSDSDEWLAASTSLGLLGVIAKVKFKIYPDFKVYAMQKT